MTYRLQIDWDLSPVTDPCVAASCISRYELGEEFGQTNGLDGEATPACRARYAAGDWAEVHNKEVQKEDNPPFYRAAAFMMRKLAVLHKKHAARRRGRGGFLPLWND